MFYIKTIKELKNRLFDAEIEIDRLNAKAEYTQEALDLLADEMGFEIDECDHCGALMLTK